MSVFLRSIGALLLILTGAGGGFAVYGHKLRDWQQLRTLAGLFGYLQGLLSYQAMAGDELLGWAARYPEFSMLDLDDCRRLADLPLPAALPPVLAQEVRSGLTQLALQPRDNACATLQRLADLCGRAAEEKGKEVQAARTLWPKLGICAGILAAILLW